ncbi:hypothetical protein M8C21_003407 [Ambrosia artemisiifolia]|uniref:Uncharacterized protein n=1 Tax=Ambrosia artemisiifolia TaxID=4212 RepID=A0AAD5C2L3_AMBAR|nr:hypothetical protein M8C21_003407 [Ambrosia artemisiifolia]
MSNCSRIHMTGDAKIGVLAVGNNNFEMTWKRFQNWLSKQRLPSFTEAAVDAYFCVGTSMAMGSFGESLINTICFLKRIPRPSPQSQFLSRCGGYRPLAESFLARDSFAICCNVILMRACNDSISYVVKNIRGKEDLETSIVAGFGYGVALSLANGMRGPGVLTVGAICALFNGGMFKAGIKMWAYDHKLNIGKELAKIDHGN